MPLVLAGTLVAVYPTGSFSWGAWSLNGDGRGVGLGPWRGLGNPGDGASGPLVEVVLAPGGSWSPGGVGRFHWWGCGPLATARPPLAAGTLAAAGGTWL